MTKWQELVAGGPRPLLQPGVPTPGRSPFYWLDSPTKEATPNPHGPLSYGDRKVRTGLQNFSVPEQLQLFHM